MVELPALVIKAMGDFMADDDPDPAIVEGFGKVFVVEGGLENASWEH